MPISILRKAGVGILLIATLAACDIATGAAVGAGAGALIADQTGNDVERGAAVGGLVGAGIGAFN